MPPARAIPRRRGVLRDVTTDYTVSIEDTGPLAFTQYARVRPDGGVKGSARPDSLHRATILRRSSVEGSRAVGRGGRLHEKFGIATPSSIGRPPRGFAKSRAATFARRSRRDVNSRLFAARTERPVTGRRDVVQATLALDAPAEREEKAPTRRPRGRAALRWAFAVVLAVGTAGWFAPAVVGRSPLRHRFLHAVVPAYPGAATVGGASLGWLDGVVLRDITLSDPQGEPLARIGELRTSRSLASLAFVAGGDLGTVTLTRVRGSVRLRPDGSNLEDAIKPLLEGESSTTGLKVVVEEGKVGWTTVDGEPSRSGIEALHATVVRRPGSSTPERVEIEGRLTDGETAGEFSVRLAPSTDGSAEGSVSAMELPVAAVQPWLERFGSPIGITGRISADLVSRVASGEKSSFEADGRVEGRRVWVTLPAAFGGETIQIDSVTLGGKVASADGRLTLEAVELRSELGTGSISGSISPDALSRPEGWEGRISAVLAQDVTAKASVDLARFAGSVGRAIRLRQPIKSGRLEVELRTGATELGRKGIVRVRTTDLVAGLPDQRVTWKEPLTADAAITDEASGLAVERLSLESEGVTIAGSGSLRACAVRFESDLDRLRGQLAHFVDLPEGRLAGHASGTLDVKRSESETVRLDATAAVRGLDVVLPGTRWTERNLSLTADAEIGLDGLRPKAVRSGSLLLRSTEGDELTAKLAAPVELTAQANWPAGVTLKGDLGRWAGRAAAWSVPVLPEGWTLSGVLDASGTVAYGPDAMTVSGISAEARTLRIVLPDRTLEEPYVRLVGGGSWDAAGEVLTLPAATLTSETVSAKATNVRLPLGGGQPASGSVSFRGGAGRLMRYVMPAKPAVWLSGVVGGTVELESDAASTSAMARLTFEKPVLSRPAANAGGKTTWSPLWSDEKATATLEARYRHAEDGLALKSLKLTSTGAVVDVAGRVEGVMSTAVVDISGTAVIDLEPLAGRFTAGLPDGLAAKGRARREFAVRGPLVAGGGISPDLSAQAGIGWEEVRAFGLTVGAGDLSGRLERRVVNIGPVDWPVAGGRLRGTASVGLEGPPVLVVGTGRVADGIQMTPELCRTWLRYAAPSLADATEVQGTASIDVEACQIPLLDPTRMEGGGGLVIQGADATPGPLARSILDAVRQVQAIAGRESTNGSDLRLVVPAQNVRLTVAGGRVTHDRFAVRLGDAEGALVATSGSVGFDETVDLVAEVPLDAKWFKEERVAQALGGQMLRIPIRGTLGRPAVDPRAFQDLARRAAAGAVKGTIDRQLEKQLGEPLRKLFD